MRASLDGLVSAEGSCGFVAEKRFPKVPKTKAEKKKTLKKTLNITYYIKSYSHKIIVSNGQAGGGRRRASFPFSSLSVSLSYLSIPLP